MADTGAAVDASEPVLEGPAVRLRPWHLDDVPTLVRACADPEIARWTTVPSPYCEADALDFLQRVLPATRAAGGAGFAVEADGAVVASLALVRHERGVGELGYWSAPWARRRGHLRAAIGVLLPWCGAERGLRRLELSIDAHNTPSRALALAAGFVPDPAGSQLPADGRAPAEPVVHARLAEDRPSPSREQVRSGATSPTVVRARRRAG